MVSRRHSVPALREPGSWRERPHPGTDLKGFSLGCSLQKRGMLSLRRFGLRSLQEAKETGVHIPKLCFLKGRPSHHLRTLFGRLYVDFFFAVCSCHPVGCLSALLLTAVSAEHGAVFPHLSRNDIENCPDLETPALSDTWTGSRAAREGVHPRQRRPRGCVGKARRPLGGWRPEGGNILG